jgi:hypothetical protein
MQLHPTRKPNGILTYILPALRIIIPESVVKEPGLTILILPGETKRDGFPFSLNSFKLTVNVNDRRPRLYAAVIKCRERCAEVVGDYGISSLLARVNAMFRSKLKFMSNFEIKFKCT